MSSLNDIIKIDISPLELSDYVRSLNWQIEDAALADGLYVFNSPESKYFQIQFSTSSFDDTKEEERVFTAIQRLSEYYKKSAKTILDEAREVNDDIFSLRYYSENKKVNSMSFEEALDAIEATRQLLLSAGSSVVNPTLFHPKLNRTEPQELIKKARFRHTKEGSFVIKVSFPFESLHGNEKPFSRRALEKAGSASKIIENAIIKGETRDLFEQQKSSDSPEISYNFCEALTRLFDDERELSLDLNFEWSKTSTVYFPADSIRVKFPYSYKTRIEEVKETFTPNRQTISDSFVGTVDVLSGEIGYQNKRTGEITLALLVEGEIIKAKANLTPDQYDTAVEAHRTPGSYIQVKGVLKQRKRIYVIENIESFSLM